MPTFTITFHTPFAVSRGESGAGFDSVVDETTPLPAGSLKGVMRAAASGLLPSSPIVREIFGEPGESASWAWTDAEFGEAWTIVGGTRIAIGDDGIIKPGLLQFRQQVFASRATFDVERIAAVPAQRAGQHELVLRAAARAVLSLGSERRRGSGWVTITEGEQWSATDTASLRAVDGGDE